MAGQWAKSSLWVHYGETWDQLTWTPALPLFTQCKVHSGVGIFPNLPTKSWSFYGQRIRGPGHTNLRDGNIGRSVNIFGPKLNINNWIDCYEFRYRQASSPEDESCRFGPLASPWALPWGFSGMSPELLDRFAWNLVQISILLSGWVQVTFVIHWLSSTINWSKVSSNRLAPNVVQFPDNKS